MAVGVQAVYVEIAAGDSKTTASEIITGQNDSPDVLSQEQVGEYLNKLENYKRVDSAIERLYTFKGFRGAVKFINAVADECVKHNHHPTITNMYGHVRLNWTTHSTQQGISGVTSKDIELAWSCNKAYENAFGRRDLNDKERELEGI